MSGVDFADAGLVSSGRRGSAPGRCPGAGANRRSHPAWGDACAVRRWRPRGCPEQRPGLALFRHRGSAAGPLNPTEHAALGHAPCPPPKPTISDAPAARRLHARDGPNPRAPGVEVKTRGLCRGRSRARHPAIRRLITRRHGRFPSLFKLDVPQAGQRSICRNLYFHLRVDLVERQRFDSLSPVGEGQDRRAGSGPGRNIMLNRPSNGSLAPPKLPTEKRPCV